MKQTKVFAIILGIAMLLSACQSDEQNRTVEFQIPSLSTTEETEPSETGETEPTDTETTPVETSNISDETDPVASESEVKITRAPEAGEVLFPDAKEFTLAADPDYKYAYQEVTIEEQEIWNQDGLVISAIDFSREGKLIYDVYLRIVNESGKEVEISSMDGTVDGFATTAISIGTFASGTTDDMLLSYFPDLGETLNLWNPHTLGISFTIEFSDGSVKTSLETPILPIITSASDQEISYDLSFGEDIYQDDTILIKALFCSSDDTKTTLWLYVENLSNQKLTLCTSESWFNGVDAGFIYESLQPGSKNIIDIYAMKSRLEENGITGPVEEILVSFVVEHDSSSSAQEITDPVRLHVV